LNFIYNFYGQVLKSDCALLTAELLALDDDDLSSSSATEFTKAFDPLLKMLLLAV
jgi:hypothetical protein